MPKQQDSNIFFSINSSQTGLAAYFCVYDTRSHVKITGCLPRRVTQQQQIRARIGKECELIITSNWLGLEQTRGDPLFDWPPPKSVEKSTPFPASLFNSCSAAGC